MYENNEIKIKLDPKLTQQKNLIKEFDKTDHFNRLYLTYIYISDYTDKTDQHHIWNWRVAQGLHRSYNDCLKEKDTSYKMQRPPHYQPYCTYSKDT